MVNLPTIDDLATYASEFWLNTDDLHEAQEWLELVLSGEDADYIDNKTVANLVVALIASRIAARKRVEEQAQAAGQRADELAAKLAMVHGLLSVVKERGWLPSRGEDAFDHMPDNQDRVARIKAALKATAEDVQRWRDEQRAAVVRECIEVIDKMPCTDDITGHLMKALIKQEETH